MSQKKYLVYLDILGFEELPQEIAKELGLHEDWEDWVRQKIILEPVRRRVEEVSKKRINVSLDSYLLTVDSVQRAFEVVGELTTIAFPRKGHAFVPLELVLDAREIDESVSVELASQRPIIEALRNDILSLYHEYCKKKGIRIKETFVLFTPEFFNDLEPLERKYCNPISYKRKRFFLADLEKIRQRARVFQFLKEIGCEGDKRFERIDEIYVPPLEYEDMANTLNGKRFLFITGTGQYGKTYTAARLMWEYYQKGYKPRWIKGGELSERNDVRIRLENITAELKPQHIIYFEDPFGKSTYEKREALETEIGTIISNVERVTNVYVIITSREEVFKEFAKEKPPSSSLDEFRRALNIKRPSYDYEKRQQMLCKWAEEKGCKWLENNELKELVLGLIKNLKVLPTPLSIWAFAIASAGMKGETELREEVEKKSQETAFEFAKEIRDMSDDKRLFLSFLFVSDYFEVSFVEGIYQELVRELNFKNAWEFNQVLGWFKDDKVSISRGHIEFSHPSYSEALKYFLVEDDYQTLQNKQIFIKLLLKLSEKDEAAGGVTWIVAENFSKLPEEVRNKLLLKLSEKGEVAPHNVACAVAENFSKLPEEVRNKLLLKLSKKDVAARYVARAVAENFDKLPEEVRNLLFKLSERDEAAGGVIQAVAKNFDKLPEEVRNKLLLKLSEKDEAASDVAWAVAENFDKLPEEVRNLLFKLSEKDEAASDVAWAVAENFDKLPEEAGDLLDKLQEPLQRIIYDLSQDEDWWIKESVLDLISRALPKLNKDFVFHILQDLSESKDKELRSRANKMPSDISGEGSS